MTPDPLGGDITNPQSLNRYAYVLNNPTTNIDPSGLTNIPGYDLGGRWGGGSCFLYLACGLPTGGGFGSNWNEFDLLNIPVVTQSYNPPQLISSSINWSALGNGQGVATSVSLFTLGGWATTQVGTGFDLIGIFDNRELQMSSPSWAGAPAKPAPPTPAQAATNYCQQHGQLSFAIPFTHIPVTVGFSATAFFNFSTANDIALTFPPSAGASLDITVGAPEGPNIPAQVGSGRNLSIGTFLTPSGPRGFSASFGPSVGSPVTFSPQVANACGLRAGGG